MNADKISYNEAKQRCVELGLKPARSIAGCLELVADHQVRMREQERLAAVGAQVAPPEPRKPRPLTKALRRKQLRKQTRKRQRMVGGR
jgi:hypothetical protein